MQSSTIWPPLRIDCFWLSLPGSFGFLLFRGQPRHHGAQLLSDFFDRVLLLARTQGGEVLAALLVFFNPLFGEAAVLDAGEDFFHCLAGLVADNLFAAGQIAVLGRV